MFFVRVWGWPKLDGIFSFKTGIIAGHWFLPCRLYLPMDGSRYLFEGQGSAGEQPEYHTGAKGS